MNRRDSLKLCHGGAAGLTLQSLSTSCALERPGSAKTPNLILITADDLNYDTPTAAEQSFKQAVSVQPSNERHQGSPDLASLLVSGDCPPGFPGRLLFPACYSISILSVSPSCRVRGSDRATVN